MDRREFMALAALGLGGAMWPGRVGAQSRVVTSRIRLVGPRVVMALTIGGRGPYDFLLDTGGYLSLIDDALAKELALSPARKIDSVGVGGRATLPVYLAQDVVFGGGARQESVAFAGIAGDFARGVRGALAAGFLTAIDSDLDFAAGEWRAYPGGRPPREGFTRLPRALVAGGPGAAAGSKRLFGDASVDGRTMRFLLDTGAPGGLSLDYDSAVRTGLWGDGRPWAPTRPTGIGGRAGVARLVRAKTATFGGVTYDRPLVMLRAAADGRSRGNDGVIGLEVLRRFTLSTDAKAGDLWLKAEPAVAAPPERYGMSGLWLDRRGDRWVVAAVGAGSPAAAAGIATGDGIQVADGDPVRAISRKPGDTAALTVTRGASARTVELTLRPYL